MPVSTLNQYSFAFNNYVFGGGTSVHQITEVSGLESLPSIRNQDDNRGYADGMFSGNDFLGGREITISILTLAGNGFSAQYNYNLLQSTLLPQISGTTPLQFQLSNAGTLQRINARIRGNRTLVDPDYTYGYIKSQYTFFCPDPRYYNDTLQTASLAVTNALGRVYNRIYNLVYGFSSSGGAATVSNNGWATTYPIITIGGPVVNPTVGNSTTGNYVTIAGSYTSTDVILVNLDSKLVTVNGTPARNLVTGNSTWFGAAPGANAFYLTGSGTLAGTTNATVSWRSAFI
jgi:hypothetical protein